MLSSTMNAHWNDYSSLWEFLKPLAAIKVTNSATLLAPFHDVINYLVISECSQCIPYSWIHTRMLAFFLSLCCMRISVFWGHERLTN